MGKRKPKVEEWTVTSLVSDAASDVSELSSEMQEWRDNMSSNNMEHLPKYDEVEQAADALEQIESELSSADDDYQKAMEGVPEDRKVQVMLITKGYISRATRASNAATLLHRAAEVIQEMAEKEQDPDKKVDLETLQGELEDQAQELENVEFPGMY